MVIRKVKSIFTLRSRRYTAIDTVKYNKKGEPVRVLRSKITPYKAKKRR